MRNHIVLIVGLLVMAPVSRATPLPPEEAVDSLVNAIHGLNNSGKEIMETWAEVRRDPRPYLPFLKARVSLEHIRAARDKDQLRSLISASLILIRLDTEEGREFMAVQLKQFYEKRDEVAAQMKSLTPSPGAALPPSQSTAVDELVGYRNRLDWVETYILIGFTEKRDPRLRDAVLSRLDKIQGRDAMYIEYFEAACREDPVVQARLKKLLETTNSRTTQDHVRRFFAK